MTTTVRPYRSGQETRRHGFGQLLRATTSMFMTAEYRWGLIRITFAASPRRGRVLAAKAMVIGAVTVAAVFALAVATMLRRSAGAVTLRTTGCVPEWHGITTLVTS